MKTEKYKIVETSQTYSQKRGAGQVDRILHKNLSLEEAKEILDKEFPLTPQIDGDAMHRVLRLGFTAWIKIVSQKRTKV